MLIVLSKCNLNYDLPFSDLIRMTIRIIGTLANPATENLVTF